ncbi:heme-binding protein 1-like [Hemitrygon akajei]|uniref:heme-binding protein 1-like n=1 Tax=Hemitrygon akajei TaxID=2704970 RepID=UPI003BF94E2E
MLRLRVTLFVLLMFQVAGIRGTDLVQESCDSIICHPVLKVIEHNGYKEIELPTLHWLHTFVDGMDMDTGIKLGLERFFNYSRFHNDAGTIVPISAPWAIRAPFENGIIKPQFSVFVSLPLEIQTPPLPKDPSVQVIDTPLLNIYESYFVTEQENEDYGRLANELKKKLENDHCSFDHSSIFITWFNKAGHVKLTFLKN